MESTKSFDSEEFSDCDKDEIKKDSKKKETENAKNKQPKIANSHLIKSISQTLNSIVEDSKKMSNYKDIVKKQSKIVFSANLIPNISIKDYLERIQMYTNIEKSTLIISLIYIDRLCHKNHFTLTYYNIHRILFSAILLSIKYNEDVLYESKYYSEVAGVKLKELLLMEYNFIALVNFNFFVSRDDYKKYKKYLENLEHHK